MAVESVVGNWKGLSLRQSGMTLTVPVQFTVTFDDQDNPMLRPLLARVAVDPHYPGDITRKIPDDFSGHPFNPYLYLRDKTVDVLNGPMIYEVTCTYTNEPMTTGSDSQRQMFANPCAQPWGFEWGKRSISEKIDMGYDAAGKPTVRLSNKCGEPFDPPLQEESVFQTLRITRNLPEWDAKLMSQYANVTNTDTFWGRGPGQALSLGPVAGRMQHANIFYWAAVYEFMFTPDDTDWTWGWQRRLLHEGYKEIVFDGDTGKKKLAPAVDYDEEGIPHPVALPVPLRLDGTRIYDSFDPDIPAEPAVAILFTTKRKKAFSALGVNR